MAPRSTRRLQYADDYTEDSDNSSYKKRRKDKMKEEVEDVEEDSPPLLEDLDLQMAMDALKKQRDANLLLIKTELQMRLDSANKLASFEEKRLDDLYENEIDDLKRKFEEDRSSTSKRIVQENIYRKHRLMPTRIEDNLAIPADDTTLTISLTDEEVLEDIRSMVSGWSELAKQLKIEREAVVIVLPGNRLLFNELLMKPGFGCSLVYGDSIVHGKFMSVEQKEFVFKPEKEKRKKYNLDSLRDGTLSLVIMGDGVVLERDDTDEDSMSE